MPQILVNYNISKNGKVKLGKYDCVFFDMPVAVAKMGVEYEDNEIIILNRKDNLPLVITKEEYEILLQEEKKAREKKNQKNQIKTFYLVEEENGKLHEATNEEEKKIAKAYELPSDTPIKDLVVINGELLRENVEKMGDDN